ncbi:peptidoglycan-binding protein [Streptomyces sp. ms191]|uniref:peptidoglycan-binding domain-containing protein n=1 Tax=Streptomyces sp. ms191 TaxID=1827978 RepID=UPI0011CE449C|nr:peptidoglycan-binding domain-containing protein [Streptomyces sp. ms191]TXS33618.1 peptidoglycan-binding protein [Streptomyces sp. ms191]
MRKPLNALLATVLAIGGAAAMALGSAGPAAAANPTCNWSASYYGAWVPNYGTTSGNVNCALYQGVMNSVAVGTLQETLNLCYGERLVVDQDFGPSTEAALRRAQQKAGTTVDGDYGPLTRKAIKHKPVSGSTCVRVP